MNRISGISLIICLICCSLPLKSSSVDLEQFEALPYAHGSGHIPDRTGVVFHDKDRAYNGRNIFISGHDPAAILMDMEGKELHRWYFSLWDIWPDYRITGINKYCDHYWRRVHLYGNGDLLAIFEGAGIIKLDKNSKLLWHHQAGEHHDLDVMEDGTIYVLGRDESLVASINEFVPVWEDYILHLNEEGKEIDRISVIECIENSKDAYLLDEPKRRLKMVERFYKNKQRSYGIDIIHTNTLEVFRGKHENISRIFKKGNILLSFRAIDTIAIIDPDEKKLVWSFHEKWKGQHQPILLKDGNIMFFANRYISNYRSAVLKINPLRKEVLWEYLGTDEKPLISDHSGAVQELPNGNILIIESSNGRVIEVTEDKEVIWEYINPYASKSDTTKIASIYDMVRFPPDFPVEWTGSD